MVKDLLSLRKAETEETLGGHGRKWRSEGKILSMSKKDKVGQIQNAVIPWDVKTLNGFFLWCLQGLSMSTKGDNIQKA